MGARLFLAACLVALAACRPSAESPAPGAPAAPPDGARLYQRNCAACHGALGRGDGPASSPTVRPAAFNDPTVQAALTDERFRETLANGRGTMPAFASLTPVEVDALLAHVRRLGGAQTP
jgi:mono/diheme cytochrome c family protein